MGRISGRVMAGLTMALLAVGGGAALAATGGAGRAALTASQVIASQGAATNRVIVLLRNQHPEAPPSPARVQQRIAALSNDQAPLQSQVASSGGQVTHSYQTVNAFAATVNGAERARLASDPAVQAVVPDVKIFLPGRGNAASSAPNPSAPPAKPGPAPPGACPTDPAKPLLEPEALSIIHAASSDPSVPTAQQLATGKGVKVAFVAEGLNVNNPDFIRPDGSHVFVDYRDFTGDGPNAPTSGAEAFGDASSIAAQGRTAYDLSHFVNHSHPLPAGCNIIVRGVAPGASLVGMKVFPQVGGAFSSTILQGMDWAVSVDHVDVLSESFGGDPIPDTVQDVARQFDEAATAAGVTVTVSSGDQGTANTIGSPASDPSVISLGATTQFRHFAQTTRGAFQFATNGWANENIAEFSSAGFTQEGRTQDLVAPGNESYSVCTANLTLYSNCTDFNGNPSPIRYFGGTSESAPLAAGVAALVIQAYRDTHGGDSPSPALIKQIVTSNANDLGVSSREQGAGELDALRAVQAARSVATPDGSPTPAGEGLLIGPGQLDLAATPGSSSSADVTVTNTGTGTQTVQAHVRALTDQLRHDHGDFTLDANAGPTFLDHLGVAQSYKIVHFFVPPSGDRMDASIAWPGPANTVNLTLIDPTGRFTAFTYHPAGGNSDYAHVDVRQPAFGTWTAVIFTPHGSDGFSGAVHLDVATSRFGIAGTVSPASLTLAPGASGTLHVALPVPAAAGDYTRDLEIDGRFGRRTVVPIVLRALVPVGSRGGGSFAGTITGGNGNGFVGEEDTFAFDVPPGAPALSAGLTLVHDPGTLLFGYLVAPDGQTLGQEIGSPAGSGGNSTLQIYQRAPEAGRWRLVLLTPNPVGGLTNSASFTGQVSLLAPAVSAHGVPDSSSTVLPRGKPTTATVTVHNPGLAALNAFVDPRLQARVDYSLVPITPSDVALPLPTTQLPPFFVVPTQANTVFAAAVGSAPITFDWGFGDPDLIATSEGDTAAGSISAAELTPGIWALAPSLLGPFSGPATGTASTGMVAHARQFDSAVSSPPGDPLLADVSPSAPNANPIAVPPGGTATIQVTFTPSAAKGSVVSGDLFMDDAQAAQGSANELQAIPYVYKVG